MKILFFNYEYPPLGGGAANATAYLLQEYAKIPDLEIDLVTSSIDAQYHLEKIGETIKIHRLPIGKNKKRLHFQSQKDLLIYSWKAYFFAEKLIKENRYDLSHSFFSVPCGFLSWRFFRKHKLPYIVSLRGADVPGYAERFFWIYQIITPLIKKIWQDANAVVSNSQGLKDLAQKACPRQKIEIIHNGINTAEFIFDLSKRSSDKFIVTPGASRITARKGLKYLIEAVALLAKKYPQIFLEIIGDGNEREDLENLVASLEITDKVNFAGIVSHQDTVSYYQKASAFVLPSLNEGMSNAMLEALATGLPIIATRTGGATELIKENINGFLIEAQNSRDIAEKIEQLILDPALAAKMSRESLALSGAMSWQKVAQQYLTAYKAII